VERAVAVVTHMAGGHFVVVVAANTIPGVQHAEVDRSCVPMVAGLIMSTILAVEC
jgi:hypothetical protein